MRVLFSFLLVLMVFPAIAQSFKTSTQNGVDLRKYKVFNIEKGAIATGGVRQIDEDAFFTEFKSFVVQQMESKGYVYSPEAAEVSVTYVVELSTQLESEDLGPLGGTPVDNAALVDQPQHWSREFTRGTLIINMTDVAKKGTVWSATGTMDVTKAKGAKLLERCVKRAFKKYPNQKK
ncbi:MAG TPA: DUF4136 domain-containing protein [Cyclobacteriaceae bacterium]|nr:DUF4136 domain-containing protein [Cyclobacteriaceae bacterium]